MIRRTVRLAQIEDVSEVVAVARRGLMFIAAGVLPSEHHVAAFVRLASVRRCVSTDCERLFFGRDARAIYCSKRCKSRDSVRASRAGVSTAMLRESQGEPRRSEEGKAQNG